MISRDDPNMMNREDVLRELELLPVWRLRVPTEPPVLLPLQAEVVHKIKHDISAVKLEVKTDEGAENVQSLSVIKASFFVLLSDDKNWAFVLPADLTGKAKALFNNILLALQINKTHTETLGGLAEVKVIVAMGETVARELLKSGESLAQLRGKAHAFEHIALIATYHPDDLLQHLALKAKAWDDLCIAKQLASN